LNHIKKTFTNGDDIGYALEEREDKNFTKFIPTMHQSTTQSHSSSEASAAPSLGNMISSPDAKLQNWRRKLQ